MRPDPESSVGRPPRSAAELQSLLMSIHRSNEPKPAGPYTSRELIPVAVDRACVAVHSRTPTGRRSRVNVRDYRRELSGRAAVVGALGGGLLAANSVVALALAAGATDLVPWSVVPGFVIGSVTGLLLARRAAAAMRPDLAGDASSAAR